MELKLGLAAYSDAVRLAVGSRRLDEGGLRTCPVKKFSKIKPPEKR
jgi:hypothetical protein